MAAGAVRISGKLDAVNVQAALGAAGSILESGAARPIWRGLGLGAQATMQKEFRDQGKRSGGWPRPFAPFIAIRPLGRGAKFTTWEDIEQRKASTMMSTGAGLNSIIVAKTPGSLIDGPDFGQAGTSLKYMAVHQRGSQWGKVPFVYTDAMKKKVRENIVALVPGKRKPWIKNPLINRIDWYFRQAQKRGVSVRRRPFVPDDYPTAADHAFFSKIIKRELAKILSDKDAGVSQ